MSIMNSVNGIRIHPSAVTQLDMFDACHAHMNEGRSLPRSAAARGQQPSTLAAVFSSLCVGVAVCQTAIAVFLLVTR
jgi:hypothetical protein